MRQYETIFVIDSLLKGNEIDEIIKRYERCISANGGTILEIQRWGKKRLAYEIKKRQYGYYVHIRFEGPGSLIKPLEHEFLLNESILRYLNIALDKQALKAEAKKKEKEKAAAAKPTVEEDQIEIEDVEWMSEEKATKVLEVAEGTLETAETKISKKEETVKDEVAIEKKQEQENIETNEEVSFAESEKSVKQAKEEKTETQENDETKTDQD